VSEEELLDALRDVLVDKLKVDGAKVQMQASLYDELGLDSIDLMTAVMAMEERFGIEISDNELEQVTTVGDAVHLLNQKVAANA
jgi:acyl carrier protein